MPKETLYLYIYIFIEYKYLYIYRMTTEQQPFFSPHGWIQTSLLIPSDWSHPH